MSPRLSLPDRAVGAYLGLAVGDALGATVEFMTPREIRAAYGVHDRIRGGGWLNLRPGAVTDDTGMALALGDSILQQGRVVPRAVAEAFDTWMRSKPVDIGNTVRRGILHWRNTGQSCVPYSDHGAGNGAAMRCLPVALATLADDPAAVRQAVLDQARVTHHNELSDEGTLFVVQLIQAALRGAPKHELRERLDQFSVEHSDFRFTDRRLDNPSGFIVETLVAVFQAFVAGDGFESALVEVVNRGGDADTTGAILGMLAGAHYGRQAIPWRWHGALDRDVARQCEQQALSLLELAAAGSSMHRDQRTRKNRLIEY